MDVVEATGDGREAWDTFVQSSPLGSFLQSWAWGEFQDAAGFGVVRLLVHEGNDPVAVALCVRRPLPFRRFSLTVPWGPVLAPQRDRPVSTTDILRALAACLRERLNGGGVFARVEPRLQAGPAAREELGAAGFQGTDHSVQPRDTLVLDLAQTEDDLLRGMHPKARYNLRLARRHGVAIEEQTNAEGLRTFLTLAREVERLGKFHYHPDRYYETMLHVLPPVGMLTLLVARYEGVPLAASILLRFGDTVTYAHGASSVRKKQVMAPYLLHWEAIFQAKAVGARRYDFFGITPPGAPVTHPWFGISRFKHAFGGAEEHFSGAWDLIAEPTLYRAYEIGREIRALLR